MISVAICDDENTIVAELETALIDVLDTLQVRYEIDVYFSGESLLKAIEFGTQYEILFLDIEFGKEKLNGVDIGKRLRECQRDDRTAIVYISWEMKYAMELFDIRPWHFLIKPLKYAKIEQIIRAYLSLNGRLSNYFMYNIGHAAHKVQVKDILYLESSGRKLILHLASGKKEEFYGSLKAEYQKQLAQFDFLFVHASYVINFDYVASLRGNELILMNGTVLPISHHRRKDIGMHYLTIMERRRKD